MSQLQKFLFDGLPVRGVAVRLTDAWQQILQRRQAHAGNEAYPAPLMELLGEMAAGAVLMQSNIKFNGALVLQLQGTGAVKVAVAEVQPSLALRATATVTGDIPADATLATMLNAQDGGRCAITLDPLDRLPGQQPYQGVVPLLDAHGQPLADMGAVLEHYMRHSEQLDTTVVLAANGDVAAGLLLQRLPVQGAGNLAGTSGIGEQDTDDHEAYQRLAMLVQSLQRQELLDLDIDTILHRLFWNEKLLRFAPSPDEPVPHFACNCSRSRVAAMLRGLGREEAEGILTEQGKVEVDCSFCGQQYRFDAVEVTQLFMPEVRQPPVSRKQQ
ncbi:MAG: Hsp33 family molecular chaperone HslO [Brachymonas sp.]|nr:Hsp33 family molecular chaperone HslO [Brachymonas sp.]